MDNAAALYSARVQYGIAKGHKFMGKFSALVTNPSSPDVLQQLVEWKDARAVAEEEEDEEEEAEESGEGEEEEEEEEGGHGEKENIDEQADVRTEAPTSATFSADTTPEEQ